MKRSKILIVDDEEKNIKLLTGMLYNSNYDILGVSDGLNALEVVSEFCPDLILLDVMMPGINGFEVCKRLKENQDTMMIPVVIITALTDQEHRLKAMEVQADDFLNKPVDRIELLIRTKSLLRIKKYQDYLVDSRKKIEGKNKQLRELEKAKEGLTNMIIHDLNNPLMSILASIDLLKMQNEYFTPTQNQNLENCVLYCQRLKDQIQSLLDIHRLEERKLELKRENINLEEFSQGLLAEFSIWAKKSQVSLSLSTAENLPRIEFDPMLMQRVMANLVNNAIRHTPAGGEVQILIEPSAECQGVIFSVKDTGNGISKQYHKQIFGKFEQIDLKQNRVRTGSCGLGLAFCKLSVEAHGGKIWVESEGKDKGCAFKFTVH